VARSAITAARREDVEASSARGNRSKSVGLRDVAASRWLCEGRDRGEAGEAERGAELNSVDQRGGGPALSGGTPALAASDADEHGTEPDRHDHQSGE